MKSIEADLEKLFREGIARTGGDRSTCPSAEELSSIVSGEASRHERDRLADHLALCSECAEELRLTLELKPWIVKALKADLNPKLLDLGVTGRLEQLWIPRWNRLAAVAVIAFIAIGAASLWRVVYAPTPAPPAERGVTHPAMTVEPPEGAALSEPPRQFSWVEAREAESYQVALYDDVSTPIWESPQVKAPPVALPPRVGQSLRRDRPYYWRVLIFTKIDRHQTNLIRFTVTGP